MNTFHTAASKLPCVCLNDRSTPCIRCNLLRNAVEVKVVECLTKDKEPALRPPKKKRRAYGKPRL